MTQLFMILYYYSVRWCKRLDVGCWKKVISAQNCHSREKTALNVIRKLKCAVEVLECWIRDLKRLYSLSAFFPVYPRGSDVFFFHRYSLFRTLERLSEKKTKKNCINARINIIADMNLIIKKGYGGILIELWIKILIIILLPLGLCVHAQNQHTHTTNVNNNNISTTTFRTGDTTN